ncbi:MAG: hypothetical protein ACXWQO_14245 [Bdellovibrionota bacterium]
MFPILKPSYISSGLVLALLISSVPAKADDSLACDLVRKAPEASALAFTNTIVDSNSVVQDTKNTLGLRVDASLAPGSFIFVMQDDLQKQRIAFTGGPGSVAWDGARMTTSNGAFSCRKKSTEPAKEIPSFSRTTMNYLVCLVDEATYVGGQITKTERVLQTQGSANSFHRPMKIEGENDKVAFSVNYFEFDPVNGLEVKLTDKANGQVATYSGPPESFKTSFMFGFTQGDREGSAKFLRMGCAYTDDPKLFLETK